MKSSCTLILCALLFCSACSKSVPNDETALSPSPSAKAVSCEENQSGIDRLGKKLSEDAEKLLLSGEDVEDMYSLHTETAEQDIFPSRFDLRDRGVITPVKSQDPLDTCWSFAVIAASEASILSSLQMSAEEYEEQYGEAMDLSERHLAWFNSIALPEAEDYPEGSYPYDISQASEGFHALGSTVRGSIPFGGNYMLASSSLGAGIGAVRESLAPYTDQEGTLDPEKDWSLPESSRFIRNYSLKQVNILPNPSRKDESGSYVYYPAGTSAIKKELLAGKGVAVSYAEDGTLPEDPQSVKKRLLEEYRTAEGISSEEMEELADYQSGVKDISLLSDQKLMELIRRKATAMRFPENPYPDGTLDREEMILAVQSSFFGQRFDRLVLSEKELAEQIPYLSFSGENNEIFAHYTYEYAKPNHAVTIIGWDDSFPASAFQERNPPPSDGAWIVKNSFGEDWGDSGFFYLSYYDQSLCSVYSFEYDPDEISSSQDPVSILEYDFMPAELISSALFETPVSSGNLFTAEENGTLQEISVLTGNFDTDVTVRIYLLNENPASIEDGILAQTTECTFPYAGFHRIELNEPLILSKGEQIGITVTEQVPTEEGKRYSLVCTDSLGEKAPEAFNALHRDTDGRTLGRYCKGIINPGESHVSFTSGSWLDWHDVIEQIQTLDSCSLIAYDNLPIKAYIRPLSPAP